jgi:hypothetical protein
MNRPAGYQPELTSVCATMLTQLGFDPNSLPYFYGGLHQKLVGVEGAEPIRKII